MFDKFTEQALRTIFFARHEASQFGSRVIDAEHLLLAICRYPQVFEDLGGDHLLSKSIEDEGRNRTAQHEELPSSIDLPLSDAVKRILQYAFDETTRLNHRNVTVHHLTVAVLHEEDSVAAQILLKCGMDFATARQALVKITLNEAH